MTSYLKGVHHYSRNTQKSQKKHANNIEHFKISTSEYSKNSVRDVRRRIA